MTITRQQYISKTLIYNTEGVFFEKCPIMSNWEEPYMKRWVRELMAQYNPKAVLEVGFYKFSHEAFQEFKLDKHYIVEAHPDQIAKLKKWAKDKPNVVPIEGFVEDVKLPAQVDFILDDRHAITNYGDEWLKGIKYGHYEKWSEKKMMGMTDTELLQFYYQRFGITSVFEP